VWDIAFRPACADPRGMALIDMTSHRFWCDIYLLSCRVLKEGWPSSVYDAIIADGSSPPINPTSGKAFDGFDYETAKSVLAQHGKQLLSIDEFFAAAYGVTEKTAAGKDPKVTKLDAPRTSKFGIMQATGNMWVWGHDGDPDEPRASLFGGSWLHDGSAGSRYALVDYWPDYSVDNLGARGRCDHLQLG
jgi:hypothetical protein